VTRSYPTEVLISGPGDAQGTPGARAGTRGALSRDDLRDDPRQVPSRLFLPGQATGIGSLPHADAADAARFVLRCLPELPAAPQLPNRSVNEDMLSQWLRALPEVDVAADGHVAHRPERAGEPVSVAFDDDSHGGLLAFLDLVAALPTAPAAVKLQVTGPLTLGTALLRMGAPRDVAFQRAALVTGAWCRALGDLVRDRLPGVVPVVFLDEPALVQWASGEGPTHHDDAVDLLSGALASIDGVSGVHVCGDGDVSVAAEAGPTILGVEVHPDTTRHTLPLGRHIEGDGWVAWGAVPTSRPVGDSADPLWRRLVELWCDLTRLGIDPIALRSRALVTPECGLAGHGVSQAERVLTLTRAVGRRVGDQAAATRLSVGA
jgi:methionine synthase II (cobalamin-independent)